MGDVVASLEWERYGRTVIGSMAEVLEEAVEEHRPLLRLLAIAGSCPSASPAPGTLGASST